MPGFDVSCYVQRPDELNKLACSRCMGLHNSNGRGLFAIEAIAITTAAIISSFKICFSAVHIIFKKLTVGRHGSNAGPFKAVTSEVFGPWTLKALAGPRSPIALKFGKTLLIIKFIFIFWGYWVL